HRAILRAQPPESRLLPVLSPAAPTGSTASVDFDTTKPTMVTDPEKSHVSHVTCDTASWEQQVAVALEGMEEVESYVKNDRLGFTIPYTEQGRSHLYYPDFLVRLRRDGDPFTVIL